MGQNENCITGVRGVAVVLWGGRCGNQVEETVISDI